MTTITVGLLIFAAALLYSSVGHAGASGYLAAMALCGVSASVMKRTALTLNILVATIATARFYRAGCFSWSLLWPFALASVPLAFVGGAMTLPGRWYKPAVGGVLSTAYRMARLAPAMGLTGQSSPAPMPVALASGARIGFLSGLTGTGGRFFLNPSCCAWDRAARSVGDAAFAREALGRLENRGPSIRSGCPRGECGNWPTHHGRG